MGRQVRWRGEKEGRRAVGTMSIWTQANDRSTHTSRTDQRSPVVRTMPVRRLWAKRSGLALAALALVFAGSVWFESLMDIESHYSRWTDAERAGAFRQGWLPPLLPASAADIWEIHNIDTNETWACFTTAEDLSGVRAAIVEAGGKRVGGSLDSGPDRYFVRRPWWPEPMSSAGVEIYEMVEDRRFRLRFGLHAPTSTTCMHRGFEQ